MLCRRSLPTTNASLRRALAFTLAELLAVMGIIAILLVAVLPAVRGLSNATSRHGAVGTLIGVLDRARMMAVSDGLATYVVFAVPGGNGQQLKKDLWGRAYAIYQDHDNITFTPEQRTPWMQLPQGMVFKISEAQSISGQRSSTVTTRPLQASSDPVFPVAAGALNATGTAKLLLPYWKFDGTGGVDEQDPYYLRLMIFPGLIDTNGNEVATQSASGTGANLSKMLLEEITVNPATGRARYTVNPANMSAPTPAPST